MRNYSAEFLPVQISIGVKLITVPQISGIATDAPGLRLMG